MGARPLGWTRARNVWAVALHVCRESLQFAAVLRGTHRLNALPRALEGKGAQPIPPASAAAQPEAHKPAVHAQQAQALMSSQEFPHRDLRPAEAAGTSPRAPTTEAPVCNCAPCMRSRVGNAIAQPARRASPDQSTDQRMTLSTDQGRPLSTDQGRPLSTDQGRPLSTDQGRPLSTDLSLSRE